MKSKIDHQPQNEDQKIIRQEEERWSFRAGMGVDIKFGMPKFNCRFHGICKLDLDEGDFRKSKLQRNGKGRAWLFIPQEGYCLLCFDKQSLLESTRQLHFSRSHFELREAAPFSDDLNRKLGRNCSLQVGRYRIREHECVYAVLFRLSFHL